MITEQHAKEIIAHYSEELLNKVRRQPIIMQRQWASKFPQEAGIYAVFLKDEVVYIGETGKIRGRLCDLMNTQNHTLRRNLCKGLFSEKEGFQKASSKKKFPPHIEEMVNEALEMMEIAFMPISLGRTEIEEYSVVSQC